MMASPPHDHHHHHHHPHQPKMLKPSSATATTTSSSSAAAAARPPEHGLKCPRCDSSNTKFCYYNNYSLSQPRHFCKTCRRYWTKGGALRNVPVGGGCRKSKKSSSKSVAGPASYSSSPPSSAVLAAANGNFPNGGFQLGMVPFSGGNQLIGFNYPIADEHQVLGFGVNQSQSSAIASSIESLSSINQDLHWKLQQQRLAMLFGAAEHKAAAAADQTAMIETSHDHHHHDRRHEPIMPISFQGADKAEICGARSHESAAGAGAGAGATGWFLESNGRMNGNGGGSNNNSSAGEWNGIAAWSDMPQFSALP